MFGSSMPGKDESIVDSDTPNSSMNSSDSRLSRSSAEKNGSASPSRDRKDEASPAGERKRRSSGVAKAKDIFSNARQTLHLHSSSPKPPDDRNLTPMQKLSASDPALGVPQGSFNNSAGESRPGPNSTFRVGVTEDKNKKCRRTMEDTHAYLYNFLSTPAPATLADGEEKEKESKPRKSSSSANASEASIQETDNGYFAIFDGHAGTFAADWCGKKLHHILEDTIRKNPNTPIPELLDQTFTIVDQQLEKLPLKNSGCTAAIALLRWEDRVPNPVSATGSTYLNQAVAKAESTKDVKSDGKAENENSVQTNSTSAANDISGERTSISSEKPLKELASRQRVLYTANVGDARIVLCRNGRALRLSYDHKGSDENEGRRVANAGGLILNNRVNGVLAVTRALGDAYMKDLVTGHPYTTETVIQPDHDEFIVLACDGLWDVCTDQEAVDLVRGTADAQAASKQLVDHALARFSTDNLSCMIVRFDSAALKARRADAAVGVQADPAPARRPDSEADALVESVRRRIDESGEVPPMVEANAVAEGVMADIEEHPGEDDDAEAVPRLDDTPLKEAQEKAKRHGGGG